MFGKRIPLFSLFGFSIRLDLSWLVIGILITWSLAQGFFPSRFPDLSEAVYWWMGFIGTMGLFASIVFHELWHSLVARRFGLQIRGITLFIFGGVAEMDEEPKSAVTEFFMALAGPLSSILLAAGLYGLLTLGRVLDFPVSILGVLGYLSFMNLLLAAFNLVPAYPLDGGRVFRSVLWRWRKDFGWATRVAARVGSAFGTLLILFGIWNVLSGKLFNGIWWLMIGMFLRNASLMSYQQDFTRKALEGTSVRRFMTTSPVTVPAGLTLDRVVEDFVYRHHHKLFPVVSEDRLVGCLTTSRIGEMPRQEWSRLTAGETALPCSPENTIGPEVDAMEALSRMNRTGASRLMVVEDGKLTGILTLKDILSLLSIKLELDRSRRS